MNIFTVNQATQVYVMKTDSTVVTLASGTDVTKDNSLGTIGVGATPDGKSLYFKHLGAGGITRSDLIDIDKIASITGTSAKAMAKELKTAKITLNAEALDEENKLIAGQDYILGINFTHVIGLSADNKYFKYGMVHGIANMTASAFYLKMAKSIAVNMSREAVQLVKVYVTYGTGASAGKTEITKNSNIADTTTFNKTYTGLLIAEVEQDWILGIKQRKPVMFTLSPDAINNGVDDVIWGDVIYSNGTKVTGGVTPEKSIDTTNAPESEGTLVNSKDIADMEYFYMGARADEYRMVNFPDYVPTTYLADPSNQYGYDVIGIHYSYVGDNHAVQKSEKDINILVPRTTADTSGTLGTLAASLLTAINGKVNP